MFTCWWERNSHNRNEAGGRMSSVVERGSQSRFGATSDRWSSLRGGRLRVANLRLGRQRGELILGSHSRRYIVGKLLSIRKNGTIRRTKVMHDIRDYYYRDLLEFNREHRLKEITWKREGIQDG